MRILCVAEKPAVAKELANALAGGRLNKRTGKSKFNPVYDLTYNFTNEWGSADVVVTSVLGHIKTAMFKDPYNKFSYPPGELFNAPVFFEVEDAKMKNVAKSLEIEGRNADVLYIWTDCDREGEFIGDQVSEIVKRVNNRVVVKRAIFSNVEASHIRQAASRPVELDMNAANAARARSELDLRTGFSMTRLQTNLKNILGVTREKALSYGSCQFPTMGFVIDRYLKYKNFKPERFWKILLNVKVDETKCTFNWDRNRLFDHASAFALYDRMLDKGGDAVVTNILTKPTKQFKPLPMTTVTLQKLGAKYLKMNAKDIMDHAEKLYQRGFISYPRTETDQFDHDIDLKKIIQRLTRNDIVGAYATKLIDEGGFNQPRRGKNNDKAHPPIHPVQSLSQGGNEITSDQRKVYEFIARHFLACCSDDAKGEQTTVHVEYGEEKFHVSGVTVKEKNYLEIYIYAGWSSTSIPSFEHGQKLDIMSCLLSKGETSQPSLLTESELIGLMNANGIGTDATMADHIANVKSNEFICEVKKGKSTGLVPTTLGMALSVAYNGIDLGDVTQPHLRQGTEENINKVAKGERAKDAVLTQLIKEHEQIFTKTQRNLREFTRLAKEEFDKQPQRES